MHSKAQWFVVTAPVSVSSPVHQCTNCSVIEFLPDAERPSVVWARQSTLWSSYLLWNSGATNGDSMKYITSTVAHRSPKKTPMLSAGSVSGQPHSNRWWCHDIGYPLLDAELSLCTAPWSGTPCRTTSVHSRTMSPLDRAWKPGFSPGTSVFSALETFVIIALYKSTFTVP